MCFCLLLVFHSSFVHPCASTWDQAPLFPLRLTSVHVFLSSILVFHSSLRAALCLKIGYQALFFLFLFFHSVFLSSSIVPLFFRASLCLPLGDQAPLFPLRLTSVHVFLSSILVFHSSFVHPCAFHLGIKPRFFHYV